MQILLGIWSWIGKCLSHKDWMKLQIKNSTNFIVAIQYINSGLQLLESHKIWRRGIYTEREFQVVVVQSKMTWWASFFDMMLILIRNQNLWNQFLTMFISHTSGKLYFLPKTVLQNIHYKCLLGQKLADLHEDHLDSVSLSCIVGYISYYNKNDNPA